MANELNGTPEGTGAVEKSYDDHIMDLADILDEPDEGTPKEQAKEDAVNDGDEPELTADDLDEENPDEDEDQPDYDKGRFAADAAKVKLDDGSMVTVAELKRGFLREADYTRKRMQESEQAKAVEERYARVETVEKSLAEQRDFLMGLYQSIIPPEPTMAEYPNDPIGYMYASEEYKVKMRDLNALSEQVNAGRQKQAQETAAQKQERLASEQTKLVQLMPELKDPAKFEALKQDIMTYGVKNFGLTPEELGSIEDARYIPILKKAIAYDKLVAKRAETQKTVNDKPRLVQSGRRLDPKALKTRDAQQRAVQLRKTGSLEAGIAALMDLDL